MSTVKYLSNCFRLFHRYCLCYKLLAAIKNHIKVESMLSLKPQWNLLIYGVEKNLRDNEIWKRSLIKLDNLHYTETQNWVELINKFIYRTCQFTKKLISKYYSYRNIKLSTKTKTYIYPHTENINLNSNSSYNVFFERWQKWII